MREQLLNKILNHCVDTTTYYMKHLQNTKKISLQDFPIITKEIVSMNNMDFLSSKYIKLYQQGKLINKKTSGSTGECLDVYWSHNNDTLASLEACKYRKQWYDISIKDRYVSFHTTIYFSNCLIENENMVAKRGTNLSLSKNLLNKENIGRYIAEIKQFSPVWMFTQPSILHILLSLSSKDDKALLNKMKYIELTGEYLTESYINYFKECLPNVVFANMYGTTETGCVALECPNGNMHVLNNAVVTVMDDDYKEVINTEGNILLTTLKNYAMPLVLYRIGDRGILHSSECSCGLNGNIVDISLGREGDIIILPNGDLKSCYTLLKSIETVNDEYNDPITEFHFVQEDEITIIVHLSIKPQFHTWKKAIEELLIRVLKDDFPGITNFKIIYGELELLKEKNKIKFFERNFNKELDV